ncbi:MAG: MFS transporter, partial [Pseudomonadota bacterium]
MTAAVEAPAIAPGRVRGMASAIAAISIFAFGVSLTFPLFSILLERMGASGTMIGLNGASAAAAILLGGLTIPAILRFVSLPLLMISCSSLMAALILVFPVFPDPWVWLCLRFFFGFAAAGLFVSSEIWIVSAAPPARRGLAIGVYGFFLALGFLAGPLLLKALGTDWLAPFSFGAAISLCAIPPVIWAWRDRPDLSEDGPP